MKRLIIMNLLWSCAWGMGLYKPEMGGLAQCRKITVDRCPNGDGSLFLRGSYLGVITRWDWHGSETLECKKFDASLHAIAYAIACKAGKLSPDGSFIEHLEIDNECKLTKMPEAHYLARWAALRTVSLEGNPISFPSELGAFTQITSLYLSNNRSPSLRRVIAEELCNLVNLKMLEVNFCNLEPRDWGAEYDVYKAGNAEINPLSVDTTGIRAMFMGLISKGMKLTTLSVCRNNILQQQVPEELQSVAEGYEALQQRQMNGAVKHYYVVNKVDKFGCQILRTTKIDCN